MNVFAVAFLSCSVSVCAIAGENLLRDDMAPDNLGGVLGWSASGDSNVRVELLPAKPEKPGDPNGVRIVGHRLGKCASGYKFQTSLRLPLVRGERYRISAQVRTRGLKGMALRFIIADNPSHKGVGLERLPGDTDGEWRTLSWEGVLDLPSGGDYACVLFVGSDKSGFPDDAWIDFRAPRLEGPVRSGYDKTSLMRLEPFPLRVTPVDPLLSELRSSGVEMLFYCPAVTDSFQSGSERKMLRATVADRTVTVPFGPDGKAKAVFGPMAPGKVNLRAEMVGADSGKVYACNDYRAHVRGEIEDATPMKRLNNFVSEMVRRPYSEGDIALNLAKDTWMYVALSDVGARVEASFDGRRAKFFPEGGRMELMHRLPRGRHVLTLKGEARGEVIVRSIKCIFRAALHKAARMAPNFTDYCYGEEFFRAFGLFGGMNATSVKDAAVQSPEMLRIIKMMQDRGVQIDYSYGIGNNDPRRAIYDDYLACVTNQPSYVAGLGGLVDENAISLCQGLRSKANSTEVWWHAYEQGRRIDVFFCDGATAIHRYPCLDIPELSAYANSGDGTSMMLGEAYYQSPETQADFDETVDFAKRQFKAMAAMVPAAPSRYFYLFNGWMMIGGWTSWYSTGTDMRAYNAEMLRIFATDPDFADMGGAAFSTPGCYEDLMRFVCGMLRYYCIEGETGSYAALNGMSVWPRHFDNGDFLEGFKGWTVDAAEEGSITREHREGVGLKWQGRVYPPSYATPPDRRPGCDFAVFTQSAKGPNVLRHRIVGLEPGRVYQLTCAVSDVATMERGMKEPSRRLARKVKFVNLPYLGIRIEGADEIPELRHVYDDLCYFGKKCVFPNRVVFRARTSEAEVVFSDWKDPSGPAVPVGRKTMLNYVGVYPYFYQGEGQLDDLKRLTRMAKEMKR